MRLATLAVCSLKFMCWAHSPSSGTLYFLSIMPNTIATFSDRSKHMKENGNNVGFHFVVTDVVYIFSRMRGNLWHREIPIVGQIVFES